jgi:hypothetical protein
MRIPWYSDSSAAFFTSPYERTGPSGAHNTAEGSPDQLCTAIFGLEAPMDVKPHKPISARNSIDVTEGQPEIVFRKYTVKTLVDVDVFHMRR